ncbi:MAG: hypothetical protein JWN11_1765 [Hyphomicrobiales bacterium]|nr:hypothetical protein [Hyphomicrobiales bacterium]
MLGLLALGACARPIGDFGRAETTFTHDVAMPAIGAARTQLEDRPFSGFNRTDQENAMQDRIWRFLVASHSHDWFYDIAMELKRTGLSTASDRRFSTDRYYKWLHGTAYASSAVRYATLASDIDADLATLPETFKSICAVIEVDRERKVAASGIASLDDPTSQAVFARKAENNDAIGWFTRSLRYRYESYSYALDHLLVETPHPQGEGVDARLSDLDQFVIAAEHGQFCAPASGSAPPRAGMRPIPSRYARPVGSNAGS